jgi:hypothetical protein
MGDPQSPAHKTPKYTKVDLTGQVFGRLTVLSRGTQNSRKKWLWECRCECGNLHEAVSNSLANGDVRSCGCLHKELARQAAVDMSTANRLPPHLADVHAITSIFRRNATVRGLAYTLDKFQAFSLSQEPCFYCGHPGSNLYRTQRRCRGPVPYNGLDRVDNAVGYEDGNVVPCCITCNKAKGTHTLEEFLTWVKNVYRGCYGREDA